MDKQQLLKRLETAWTALKESYTGLSNAQLLGLTSWEIGR